jgi:ATP-dependent Clp protease ATP-binding subunit ClpB
VAELQYGQLPQLEAQLKKAEAGGEAKPANKLLRTQVGAEEIAEVVSRATGIPVSKMMQGERDKLLKMEDKLHQRVVGQDEAVRLVADAIRRSRAACRTRTGRMARSCSSARRAWARPSCARRWPSSCSTARST